MLVTGEIDALYTPRTPRPFGQRHPGVRRLFTDPRPREEQYYAATGIFPIMHVVVLRRDVYEARPWLAQSLYKAFEEARQAASRRMAETAASRYMLPWLYAEAERSRQLMGEDFWSYGLAGNEAALGVFLRYSFDQGLARRMLDPAELFAPETRESYLI
jgi:4,5-dihydroxyphthalate decarboxylase